MKRAIFGLLVLTIVAGWTSPGWAAGLTLTIRGGRVSLDAQDVTLRQILAEWARVGKTKIINLERVNSGPITLKFEGLSENEALDIILRTLPGYMAAPRETLVGDASMYDRILILPTTTAVAAIAAPRGQAPMFQDSSTGGFTQLRQAPTSLNPGVLPDLPPDDPRDANDPALAAAAAAGLIAAPAPLPGVAPQGALQPPVRNAGPSPTYASPQQAPPAASPSNPWNAPAGSAMPGLATPTTPPTPQPTPPSRLGGSPRPQQADQ
jgi:hypothetical protein